MVGIFKRRYLNVLVVPLQLTSHSSGYFWQDFILSSSETSS